jgi:hypothetical protein
MKKLIVFTLLTTTSIASASSNSFWGDRDQPKLLSENLRLTQGLDMAEFNENFSKTTSELRKNYISDAKSLLKAGASGSQALKMVLKFDDRVYDRRQLAKKGMGKTIAAYFRSGIESIYDSFENRGGKRLLEISSGDTIYNAELLWGVMPGSGVYAVLKLRNNLTNTSRSFAARTKVQHLDSLGRVLGLLVFNSLHKTTFPLKLKVGYKNIEIKGIRTLMTPGYTQYKKMLNSIYDTCKSYGARMASFNEMKHLFARGFYGGGLTMGTHHWAGVSYTGNVGFIDGQYLQGETSNLVMTPNNRTLKYICVEDKNPNYSWE